MRVLGGGLSGWKNTSVDTCSSLFMPSHTLFFSSVESGEESCRRESGRDRGVGVWGNQDQRHRGWVERYKGKLDSLKSDKTESSHCIYSAY